MFTFLNRLFTKVSKNWKFKKFDYIIKDNDKIKYRDIQNRKLWRAITSFAESIKTSFTWRYIKEHMMENRGIWIDGNIIMMILKGKLDYRFKRCSTRLLMLNNKIIKTEKGFVYNNTLEDDLQALHYDKCWWMIFSQSTKWNYYWGITRVP